MKYVVWTLIALLLILHQDYWQWKNASLDFGFLPRSLTYHACLSIAAAVVWVLATKFCWPAGLDEVRQSDERRHAESLHRDEPEDAKA